MSGVMLVLLGFAAAIGLMITSVVLSGRLSVVAKRRVEAVLTVILYSALVLVLLWSAADAWSRHDEVSAGIKLVSAAIFTGLGVYLWRKRRALREADDHDS